MKRLIVQSIVSLFALGSFFVLYRIYNGTSMNHMVMITTQGILCITLVTLLGLFTFEHAVDEREIYHRNISDRWALFVGFAVLIAIFIIQLLQGHFNGWLIIVMSSIIITKAISRVIHYFR